MIDTYAIRRVPGYQPMCYIGCLLNFQENTSKSSVSVARVQFF